MDRTAHRSTAWLTLLAPLLATTALGASDLHAPAPTLWELAQRETKSHRFSTLFTAQDVKERLSYSDGLARAIEWCKRTAVTRVYVECFRDGYQAKQTVLTNVIARFREADIEVSGCVTPTKVGKSSTGWKDTISCYTDKPTQQVVRKIFEFAAELTDEIMIDDFWFTDCTCAECDAARRAKTVTIGDKTFPVSGDSWEDYRCELMLQLSREYVLAAAKRVNSKARLIIKYPQWYDRFHERGYDVVRETRDFPRIWVGTETRDYGDTRWGGTVQYEGFFLMRWLGGLGGRKCGGGWYDWLGTTERTYVEQARQTILGGARESTLFCYGGLQSTTGPRNIEALRANIPDLFKVAREVNKRDLVGLAAYKPPSSPPGAEARVFDFVGMLGLPLVPCHEFPAKAPAAFFSAHALKDPDLVPRLASFIQSGKPVLLTDGLVKELGDRVRSEAMNVKVLSVKGDPKSLLQLDQRELDTLRASLLGPCKITFQAPNRVALYPFKDGSYVVENFNDWPAEVELNGKTMTVKPRDWVCHWK